VDSDFVIQCIDDFVSRCKKPTVIVLDNATFHTSEKFREKRKAWERQDLFVFYLPKYSPHLNLIETLWRKMKYEWIRPKDYRSKTALKRRIKEIFDHFGTQFSINFSMNAFA
jgi:transposase